MRLVFAGTPPFAARALQALVAAGHDIALVLTQPDRPAGRGMRLASSAVAQAAEALGLETSKPASLKDPASQAQIAAANPELMVVAAYGLLLPEQVLAIPARGCLNIHASLLPRWRGAAPIQRAILAGDAETGISIMVMEPGLDTGPVILSRHLPILPDENAGDLTERLSRLGAQAIVEAIERIDQLEPHAQKAEEATYAAKIGKSEAMLDWGLPAVELQRRVRALNPVPGAETRVAGEPLKIWATQVVSGEAKPGTLLRYHDGCPVVACGRDALVLTIIQRPGSRRLAASEFVKARPLTTGIILGADAAA